MTRITQDEHRQGYTVCPCEKFAHIFRSSVLAQLPDYYGELCQECGLMMCAVDKLPVVEEDEKV